mmetsp:Transcript_6893/g.17978  ORF Transcript_6893/g.17978 Transcript_6893/m.17978 type:complete len:161 (-) Transcript_6893:85-567(-)
MQSMARRAPPPPPPCWSLPGTWSRDRWPTRLRGRGRGRCRASAASRESLVLPGAEPSRFLPKKPFHELPTGELRDRLVAAGGKARAGAHHGSRLKPRGAAVGGLSGLNERTLPWVFVERYLVGAGVVHRKTVGLGHMLYLTDVDAAARQAAQPIPREYCS